MAPGTVRQGGPFPPAPPEPKALDLDRLVIVSLIAGGIVLLVLPFYVLYFRLVQRILP